jgi:hypothetical protein
MIGVEEREPGPVVEGVPVRDEFVVNYFSYFTDIEQHFVRRRGKHLLVSPLDWALIESWKDMNVPMHIVLRGIDRVFDAYEAAGKPHHKRINSILYCQQEVLTCYEEYMHSRVGAPQADVEAAAAATTSSAFSKEIIWSYLAQRLEELNTLIPSFDSENTRMQEALQHAATRLNSLIDDARTAETLNLEALEQELGRIEDMIYDTLLEAISSDEIKARRREGAKQLREYKKRMSPEVYEQTLGNYVAKQLRENYRIPRLSLFYLT